MIKRLSDHASQKRVRIIFRVLNLFVAVALLAFALRGGF